MAQWKIEDTAFCAKNVEQNGSRYLIGNGYMGYRGTLEEFGAAELVALNMAGLFDKNGDLWRESVNAPNPFYTLTTVDGVALNPLTAPVAAHRQTLDISVGVHSRETAFSVGGATVTITAERFVSMADEHLAVLSYAVTSDREVTVTIETHVDTDVWSINGDHFAVDRRETDGDTRVLYAHTLENNIPLQIYEHIVGAGNENTVTLSPERPFRFYKVVGVYWGEGCPGAREAFAVAAKQEYKTLRNAHTAVWQEIWAVADVVIEGDDEAQLALRYSIYHLSSIAPQNTAKCGIPARGLSGQVYKGAAFWDTEMFMLPFFSFTNTKLARNLVRYRLETIGGARRKAKEFGYEGAFYAWESQETGDDACTLFNVTDIFTGRPMRTHFKDRQIHVSADMVYGLWEYCTVSGDYSILLDGGLDMIYECLLFFYSYASYKPLRGRYELHQVVGPDEYHERVDNNAFTSRMVAYTAGAFSAALAWVEKNAPEAYRAFCESHDIALLTDFAEKLYVPQPNENGVIEQFDGYFGLEDVSLATLRSRIIEPNEYLGGGNGLATTTRILKQADVVMMLNVFRSQYSTAVKRANWEYYEPYTEHGSSLSACAYAIVAAEIGMPDWAYKYFMKTATVDLTGNSKQYLGTLYIGGTHPAANGGSWNTAVFGFGGVSYAGDTLDISPRLPAHWSSLSFKLLWRGVRLTVTATQKGVTVKAAGDASGIRVTVYGKEYEV